MLVNAVFVALTSSVPHIEDAHGALWERTEDLHPHYGLGGAMLSGFQLDVVYTHYEPQHGHPFAHPTRHKIVRHDIAAARRRLGESDVIHKTEDLDKWLNSPIEDQKWTTKRDKVLTMAKLMVLADPLNYTFTNVLDSVYSDDDDKILPNFANTKAAEDDVWFKEQRDYLKLNGIADSSAGITAACYPKPSKQGFTVGCSHRGGLLETYFGVSMLVYKNPTTAQQIIFFRGTYGKGEANIQNWITYWVIENMEKQIQQQWTSAGNSLGAGMTKKNRDGYLYSDKGVYDTLIREGAKLFVDPFLKDLAKQVPANMTAEALELGYWPLTKAIMRDYLPADRDTTAEVTGSANGLTDSVYLSGHSQGAARAAFVHMWLAKADGMTYDTTTLAAAGGQCFARGGKSLYSGGTFTGDMDMTKAYPHITQYVDAFDVYGHFDYKSAGRVCTYGVKDQKTRSVAKVFEFIVGIPGSVLMGVGKSLGGIKVDQFSGISNGNAINQHFTTTRYYTHGALAMAANMHVPGYILDDGTTDGGCVVQPVIDAAVCPAGKKTAEEETFQVWVIVIIVVVVLLVIAGVVFCCYKTHKCCFKISKTLVSPDQKGKDEGSVK